MKRTLLGLSLVLSLIGFNLSPLLAQAAGASISLTANKASVSSGGSLVVAVYMNGGGTPVNAVEADLAYPASKLQYVGLSYTGSAFSINTPSNGGGNGSISIQNGTISPVSGSGLVATVTFKALVGSGSAAISVSGSSNLINANDNSQVAYTSSGVNLSFGAGAASSSPSDATAATLAPPKDTTPPVISAIKVTQLTPFSATITWTTNEPSDSTVEYGLDTTYGLSNSGSGQTTSHSVSLDSNFLLPQTSYHFRVKSTDGAGNVASSLDQSFSLPGVPVTVVVVGPGGKPQAGAQVTLDGGTATTDAQGRATITSSLGNKKVTTTYQGVTIQKPITVSKTAKPLPPVQLDLAKQPLNRWMLTSIGLVVIVLTLLGIDAVLFGSHFFVRATGLRLASKPQPNYQATASTASSKAAPLQPFSAPETPVEPREVVAEPVQAEPATEERVATMMGPAAEASSPVEVATAEQPAPSGIPISHFAPKEESVMPVVSSPPPAPTKIAITETPAEAIPVNHAVARKATKAKKHSRRISG